MEIVTVLDCADLDATAAFWAAALNYRIAAGEPYTSLTSRAGGPELLLQRVPEAKAGKNRLHLDLRVTDLDGEVARLERLGARRLTTEPVAEKGWTWHVLADPEGNEFCVLRPPDA
jgi:predicted enzyme related to lactoylglutathione lyase